MKINAIENSKSFAEEIVMKKWISLFEKLTATS